MYLAGGGRGGKRDFWSFFFLLDVWGDVRREGARPLKLSHCFPGVFLLRLCCCTQAFSVSLSGGWC